MTKGMIIDNYYLFSIAPLDRAFTSKSFHFLYLCLLPPEVS